MSLCRRFVLSTKSVSFFLLFCETKIREKVGAHLNNLKRVLGDDAEQMTDPEELLGIFYSSMYLEENGPVLGVYVDQLVICH